ncbi:MAG: hypothetical protein R3C49_27205 [Planctomycetaceae bacterium]
MTDGRKEGPPHGPPPLPQAGKAVTPESSRNRSLLLIGGLGCGGFVLLFMCCGVLGLVIDGGSGTGTQRSRETIAEAPAESVIQISANQLFAEYEANDIAADKKYKDQILEVSGSVGDISRDILDNIYVTLKTGEYKLFSIQCFFADDFEDRAAELRPGQYLRIRGRCDGKFGNVMLKDCIIVE